MLEKQSYFYVWSLAEVSEGLFYDLVDGRGKPWCHSTRINMNLTAIGG